MCRGKSKTAIKALHLSMCWRQRAIGESPNSLASSPGGWFRGEAHEASSCPVHPADASVHGSGGDELCHVADGELLQVEHELLARLSGQHILRFGVHQQLEGDPVRSHAWFQNFYGIPARRWIDSSRCWVYL